MSYNYPIIILAANISSIVNKVFHCADLAFHNCNMQGSTLMERMGTNVKTVDDIKVNVIQNLTNSVHVAMEI